MHEFNADDNLLGLVGGLFNEKVLGTSLLLILPLKNSTTLSATSEVGTLRRTSQVESSSPEYSYAGCTQSLIGCVSL